MRANAISRPQTQPDPPRMLAQFKGSRPTQSDGGRHLKPPWSSLTRPPWHDLSAVDEGAGRPVDPRIMVASNLARITRGFSAARPDRRRMAAFAGSRDSRGFVYAAFIS
jgi:hypothetical protein